MSRPGNASPRRVLVVDDSIFNQAMIERLLRQSGFEVLTASDGAEGAVKALGELPDAVVTDLEMPVMNGYQLARLLKSDPVTRTIPVLILTSHGDASSRFWGLETGADAFIVKDDLEGDLLPAVRKLVDASQPIRPATATVPKTPIDVLARVGQHLDERLLEAVFVNRILEGGMQAETLRDAGEAILDTVCEIVDVWLLGFAVSEREAANISIRLSEGVTKASAFGAVARLEAELGALTEEKRRVAISGGEMGGRELDVGDLALLELPLRGAKAFLIMVPRQANHLESREHKLLERVRHQLALVLDNARLAERLRDLSMRDGLTRLLNRRTIHQRLCEEVRRARRYAHPLSVALCDLDHFKQVNDTWGHQAGDRVLVKMAEILQKQARAGDVAGRYGGEEFLVLLPETDLKDARRAAERLRQTIAECRPVLADGRQLTTTGSLGVAALSELDDADYEDPGAPDGGLPDALLALADRRLYEAKAAGRNQVMPRATETET